MNTLLNLDRYPLHQLDSDAGQQLVRQCMEVATLRLGAGDLKVFKGKNTAHRVTPPVGELARMVSVFSYYETPGRMFSDEENMGFYGRTVS